MAHLYDAFFNSQFNYCSLSWMFHGRNLTIKETDYTSAILWIIYNHKTNSFKQLLEKDNSVFMHQRNIQNVVIKTCKVTNGL